VWRKIEIKVAVIKSSQDRGKFGNKAVWA